MNQPKVQSMVRDIVESVNNSNDWNYQKCHLLDTLKIFIYYKERVILENQTLIIYELTSKKYNNVLMLLGEEEDEKIFLKSLMEYQNQLDMKFRR